MSSHDPGKTGGGSGGGSSTKSASVKPSTEEVMDRLLEFSRQHPEMNVTTEGFATALRRLAMRKQALKLISSMNDGPVGIIPPQPHDENNNENVEPSTASSNVQAPDRKDDGTVGLPDIVIDPPTPTLDELAGLAESVSEPGVTAQPSSTRRPDMNFFPFMPDSVTASASAEVPAPTSTLGPSPVLTGISGFAAASSASGTRKAPPPPLNLAEPASKPTPNHYISMPASSDKEMSPEGMERLEQALNWHKPLAERVVLLKSPIAMLVPDGTNEEQTGSSSFKGDYSVEEIPEDNLQPADPSAYTLETPRTATFATEQIEHKRAKEDKDLDSALFHQTRLEAFLKKKAESSASKGNSDSKYDPVARDKADAERRKQENKRTSKGISRFDRVHLALKTGHSRVSKRFDVIDWLTSKPELMIQVCKHLPPNDLLNLYSVHRSLHEFINRFLRSSITAWTEYNCPEAALVFNWRSLEYRHMTMLDPAGRPQKSPVTPSGFHPWRPTKSTYNPKGAGGGGDTSSRKGKEKMVYDDDENNAEDDNIDKRLVPMLKWYIMCFMRQEAVEDILAHLARRGHRTPPGTNTAVLKLWKLMATPTTDQRRAMIRGDARSNANVDCQCYVLEAQVALKAGKSLPPLKQLKMFSEIGVAGLPEEILAFTDHDLLRIQCFFLKLELRFNDPIYGPEDSDLSQLMLSQRSLFPLRRLLFGEKYRTMDELMALKVRYDLGCDWTIFQPAPPQVLLHQNWKVLGVPYAEIGTGHVEHWGDLTNGPLPLPPIDPSKPTFRYHMIHVTRLVAEESVRRGLNLHQHMMPLMMWGCVDWKTGRNLCPTEQEIYIPDGEYKTRHIDTSEEFTRADILKSRWDSLSKSEREEVVKAQQARDDMLRKWDNNQLCDPLEPTAEKDNLVQLSYAITSTFTGPTKPPKIPKADDPVGGPIIDVDDLVETPGPVTAKLEELERRFHNNELASDDDGDSESELRVHKDTGDADDGVKVEGENTWKPAAPENDLQLPRSFTQNLEEYKKRAGRAAASSSNNVQPFFPASSKSTRAVHCEHSPILKEQQQAQQAQQQGEQGWPGNHPVVDQAFIDSHLYDLEEELEDGEEVEEIGEHDPWGDRTYLDAAHSVWDWLYLEDDPAPQSGSDDDDEEDSSSSSDDDSDDGGVAHPDGYGVFPADTLSMANRGDRGVNDHEFDYSGVDVEETVADAWEDLRDAEEDAHAAGYKNIQARED